MPNLVNSFRAFWYNNIAGSFQVDRGEVSREQAQVYGGPNPEFNACQTCQELEWLSRVQQRNLFTAHTCGLAGKCEQYCQRQGDEFWTHYHQNFWYAIGCDPSLSAPKILLIHNLKGPQFINTYNCDHSTKVFLRRLAQAAQFEIVTDPGAQPDWSRYDVVMTFLTGKVPKIKTPLPVIAYGHDLWKHHDLRQGMIDFYQPDILLTPYPTPWSSFYQLPEKTVIRFHPISASQFFTRPNLERKKACDLIVAGSIGNPIYTPRSVLDGQVKSLRREYRIEFSHHAGCRRVKQTGSNSDGTVHYLNKWSEFLGSGKFVMFGPISEEPQAVFHKHYECMASGAIPIIPEAPDLRRLNVKPMEHYIPVQNVMGNNKQLVGYLNAFEDLRFIAKKAVKWHATTMDGMMFDGFEDVIREATNNKYSRRLTK